MEEQLAKFFANEASIKEKEEIIQWRSESESNAQSFMDAKMAWLSSEKEVEPNSAILEAIMDSKPARVVGWPSYLKYAAAVSLLAMLGFLWYFNNSSPEASPLVFNGTVMELEDGSIVSLKKGSSLEVLNYSKDERKVRITGKAFFEVERDESRPFLVLTEDATVKVLGTSFQVNADNTFTEVSVESGLVSFAMNDPQKRNMSLELKKGEYGKIGRDIEGILKRKITDKNFLAWKDGNLKFERTSGIDFISILNDVYGADVSIDANLVNCKLTAQFNQKTLEEVIQIISSTFNWTYEINKDKVVLSGKGC